AYNEEKKLGTCLSSVANLADEIIVIDNSSPDGTAKTAKSFKATVYKRENNLMLNINKNYGFEKATGEWILNLDTDEEVTEELKEEIKAILNLDLSQAKKGYWIPRKNIIFGKWIQYGLWWPDKQLRLFQRGKGKFACKHIHEYIEVDGEMGELKAPYIHHNYDSISQYLSKLERYTTNESMALKEAKYQLSWYDAIRFPLSDFIKLFFAQSGYKDGLHGLVLSLFQAFYSFVVFTKLWEMEQFPQKSVAFSAISKELKKEGRDFSYWMTTAEIKESHRFLDTFILKIRRRISL
ncbi:glycosyltransferase family 2 protein, partial [Patescibacteria group bacterium]|nr:glycosyltransferase family 2 protein [Patescibacteria group bacterium]